MSGEEERYELERDMQPLLDRGRELLRIEIEKVPIEDRRIGGGSLHVVAEDDFIAHPRLCIRFVARTNKPLQILCNDGTICALLEHLTWRSPI